MWKYNTKLEKRLFKLEKLTRTREILPKLRKITGI